MCAIVYVCVIRCSWMFMGVVRCFPLSQVSSSILRCSWGDPGGSSPGRLGGLSWQVLPRNYFLDHTLHRCLATVGIHRYGSRSSRVICAAIVWYPPARQGSIEIYTISHPMSTISPNIWWLRTESIVNKTQKCTTVQYSSLKLESNVETKYFISHSHK